MDTEQKIEIIKCNSCKLRRFIHEFKENRLGERYKSCNVCRDRGKANRLKLKEKQLKEKEKEKNLIQEDKTENEHD